MWIAGSRSLGLNHDGPVHPIAQGITDPSTNAIASLGYHALRFIRASLSSTWLER